MLEAGSATREFIDRRSFLRSAIGSVIGAGLGLAVLPHLADAVNNEVTDITGHPTGNAGWDQKVKDSCKDSENPGICETEYTPTFEDEIAAQVMAPLTEETMFRAIPSITLDTLRNNRQNDPLAVVAGGTSPFKFDRKELLVGAVSSIFFGAAHNVTSKGFDTKTIPASQTVDGFIYWCLMRRFGIVSSMSTHAAFNNRALKSKK